MQHIIITGHSRGLGETLAQHYLAQNDRVLGISRHAARFAHPNLQQIALDLSDTAALMDCLAQPVWQNFLHEASRIVLINNAGTVAPNAVLGQQNATDIARTITLNIAAPMLLGNHLAQCKPKHALLKIVYISSGAGRRPFAGWNVYGATKAALDQHAQCVAAENHANILVGSIAPGVVDTQMQAEIRTARADAFPMRSRFVQLKAENALTPPKTAAARIACWIDSPEFGRQILADVRELPQNIEYNFIQL